MYLTEGIKYEYDIIKGYLQDTGTLNDQLILTM